MDQLLNFLIALHNLLRWVWVLAAVLTLGFAVFGWLQKRAYTSTDRMLGITFVSLMDLQLLVGGILYVIGEWGFAAFSKGGGMQALYFAVEHAPTMLVALVVAHIGSARVKRAADSVARHRLSVIFYTIAVLLVLVAIPWTTRPLLRGF
jgi:hypothetical protein